MCKFHILVITETHVDVTVPESLLKIDRYKMKRCDRNRHGGGCLIYFDQEMGITEVDKVDNLGTESVWLDLHIHSQHFIIAGLYRPPDKVDFMIN